jgi:N-carbamoylputrescine amidase
MPQKNTVTIALVQLRCCADTAVNLSKAIECIGAAAKRGAQIVCLPELFRSLYFCQSEDHENFKLAETIPGESTRALAAAAKRHRLTIIGSLFEKRSAGVYHNTAVVFDERGRLIGKYRKMHIPDDPLYYEKFYFSPGDLGFQSFKTRHATIGTLICWDQWYPEAARITALKGAQILFYPTAIGWHPREKKKFGAAQHNGWETIQRSHAIANGIFVAVANRVGFERPVKREAGIEFWGQSFIVAPSGELLAKAGADKEEILVADCNLDWVETVRTHWPFLRDRRVDAYSEITKRMVD